MEFCRACPNFLMLEGSGAGALVMEERAVRGNSAGSALEILGPVRFADSGN